ncbi:uncharacterized protein K02A2.6-like [Topomyia yanbarensis]|uniref:uncharacterized protein K02A2.6-like n=1 Tax=Topomyia yanbarensis TaxID=2498891 RepID=UPI00273CBDBA|nr:uncharacterized protein K02A2.6-like [Topomyia yanbarensis]
MVDRNGMMIEEFVQCCSGCILVSEPNIQPISRIEMPNKPWKKIAIDFTEVPGGHHLLVITDYFSRYIEIVIMASMTAKNTIVKLREIFARFGYPTEIVCDNGQPFSSEDFSKFCFSNGITIKHTVPYAPFQNGLVERQNRTILKTIKISVTMGRDWKTDLQDFLHTYRATPHTTTNYSPSELMFGWNIRDKLPEIKRTVDIKKQKKMTSVQRKKEEIHVIVKILIKKNKLTTTFNPEEHVVIQREGTRLYLKNLETGVITNRHVNHTKRVVNNNPLINTAHEKVSNPENNHKAEMVREPLNIEKFNESRLPETSEKNLQSESSQKRPHLFSERRSKRKICIPSYLNNYHCN